MSSRVIEIGKNLLSRVDDEDYEGIRQYRWHAIWNEKIGSYYAVRGNWLKSEARQVNVYMHRQILGLQYGDGLQADHINHETLDNRRENLRVVTNRMNGENRRDQSKYGPGIHKCKFIVKERGILIKRKRSKPFVARARVDGRNRHIGYFSTAEEAREARREFLVGEK